MRKTEKRISINALLDSFPKTRDPLPKEYEAIYEKHYNENRNALTNASKATKLMESWGHRRVARTARIGGVTLEIGAGTLNQLDYENPGKAYDVVEPKHEFFLEAANGSKKQFPVGKPPGKEQGGKDALADYHG